MAKCWIVIAALLGASAVGMGAYHAHGLSGFLQSRMLSDAEQAKAMHDAEVAVKYQMYHALAIFGVGLMVARRCTWLGSIAAMAMLLGVAGFSGGLYLMVFDIAKLHQVIPIGGGLMIVGWLVLGAAAFSMPAAACEPANKCGQ